MSTLQLTSSLEGRNEGGYPRIDLCQIDEFIEDDPEYKELGQRELLEQAIAKLSPEGSKLLKWFEQIIRRDELR